MARAEAQHTAREDDAVDRLLRLFAWAERVDLAHYAILAGIFLAAAWLRLTLLDRQSLWFDEADVVVRAQQSLADVLRTFIKPGENGPLYNLLLHFWIQIFGPSETSVRMPSALAGLATIPVMYAVGMRTLGRRAGLFAAGLLAISPYHVWYSQEAKMYSIAVLLTLVSTAFFVEALRRNERRWWIGYVVVTTLAFYFHVTTVLIFAAQSAFFLVTWRRWSGRHRAWLISVGALTLPYVPIALWVGRVLLNGANQWQPKVTLWQMTQIEATKFAVNRAKDLVTEARGRLIYGSAAAIGVVTMGVLGWGSDNRSIKVERRWILCFAMLVVLPVLMFFVVTFKQPFFNDRYLIMALPFYLLLVAAGLRGLESRIWPLALILCAALVAYAWMPLRDINRSNLSQKENWRAAYQYVAQRAEPNDLLLIHPGYLITTYDYYAELDPALAKLKAGTIPSFNVQGFDAHQMAIWVRNEAPGERVWLIQNPDRVPGDDPHHELQHWLESGGPPLDHYVFNGVDVALYKLPPPSLDPP